MKVLFYALHFAYFRNFESAICALAERGHEVCLLAEERENFGGQALAERLAATHPRITWGWAPSLEGERWFPVARKLRQALDYVRFLDPRYRSSPKLADRAAERTPRLVLWLMRLPLVNTRPGRRAVMAALMRIERVIPPSARVTKFLAQRRPDVVLLASITYSRSAQLDHLKGAKALGVPTGVCVMSWDHLSSKALIHVVPDRVIVWNEMQKREAIEMHGIPANRIEITGAQCYDQWFGRQPGRSREEFCRSVGLPRDRPFLLYVCSAMTPSPGEPAFVQEWIARIRSSSLPGLRDVGILIRPHPERIKEWAGIDLSGFEHVAFHGRNPIDPEAKADLFESLYYSSAVVGIVTSAFIEAAIVGRPVLTPLVPRFRIHQEAMLHFRYLLEVEGGVLRVARSIDEHLAQLSAVVTAPSDGAATSQPFLEAFVRPRGLDVPATPIIVEAIERLGVEAPVAERPAWWHALARPIVRRVVLEGDRGLGRWLMLDRRELEHLREEREKAIVRDGRIALRAEELEAEQRAREEKLRHKEDLRSAKTRQREARLREQHKRHAQLRRERLKGRLKHLLGMGPS